ncbi:MAG: RNA polymerase factor sigma-54 [Gammaproteobacteria bacterium]
MKTLLQLKTSQQLKMTPQLQQAIRLLQLSTAELNLEIREALESNMMLEIDEPDVDVTDQGIDLELEDKTPEIEISPSHALEGNQAYDEHASSFIHSGDVSDIEGAHLGSLKAHLLWQLNLLNLSDIDYVIAVSIIDAIDNRGRLSCSLDEIKETLRGSIEPIPEIDEINLVLKIIQEFDPIGVGARTLSECLLLQLAELPKDTPLLNEACLCVDQHMSLLGARNYQDILDNLSIRKDELIHILRLIKDLNPRPGEQYDSVSKDYIVPDVFVFWEKGGWNIELNNEAVPKIRVNLSYSNLARKIEKKEDQLTIKTHLHEARWLIKSIESRNDTLSRVARAIVEHQSAFLAFGEEAMKPLVLNDIASSLDMHESTISRITTQKYMHTPRGVFELKYFFSSHVSGSSGATISSTAIRAIIKKLIASENKEKPLSDSKLSTILSDQGIKVARRTVAKYRESLLIPASVERKELS